jgi:hypothetical protein
MLDIDAGDPGPDPTLGGPCEDDGQCDDGVDCTVDSCDTTLGRCRFNPDDDNCPDPVFCDGKERCDVRAGCVSGEPVTCSDGNTCTIDRCDEATKSCSNEPRDADQDGDPTRSCGGHDCDDDDALVSSTSSEVCGNGRDDDCDGDIDEADCAMPEHDSCADALEVTASGTYHLDLTAARLDYPNACAKADEGFRDAVLTLVVPDGDPVDVDITARRDEGKLALATGPSCGSAEGVTCVPSFLTSQPGRSSPQASRMLLRSLAAGRYPIYLAAAGEGAAQLRVEYRSAEQFGGDRCGDALALEPNGAPRLVRLPAYAADVRSACKPQVGDAFVSFELEEARDVTLIAEAMSDLGTPVLSLLDGACKREVTCRKSQPGRLFVRNLAPGRYGVAVSATGPDDVSVRLETAEVSPSPEGEGCDDPPLLDLGVERLVDLSTHEDAVDPGCLVGAPDAAFAFELDATSDVAVIGRFADSDTGAVSIAGPSCEAALSCRSGLSIQRAVKYGLGPGEYRAVIESARGNPVGVSWLQRPAQPAVLVPFADDCEGLVAIPEVGGRFSGNTSNAFPDFDAGCDVGGQQEGGAPDQILKLHLNAPRRVVLDMQGSDFNTMLSVRQGDFCPGAEMLAACAPGYLATRSYLDLDLQAGDYFVQIDGYDGASGAWKLDVFTTPL